MKYKNTVLVMFFVLVAMVCFVFIGCSQENAGSTDIGDGIRVMSYNINVNDPEHKWTDRREFVLKTITETQPDIVGFQEVSPIQYQWLKTKLRGYTSVITYRDDRTVSEACPVFFSKSKFALVDSGTFWLSETPDVMSTDWGAEYYRICTYVTLERLSDKARFAFYNTHLDNSSVEAREKGIQVVLGRIEGNGGLPSVVTGDFNANARSQTYKITTDTLTDTKTAAKESDDGATYQNWGQRLDMPRIDYIFVSSDFSVDKFKIVDNTYNGKYASDHFAIYAELYLESDTD
ncbi:MAG: endonuclease/exonuclease/phosphatase family protein [Clostridia bacterium]|nr:endonuclease/exonuclease/phosphatase family protein [Clostridia bacterium]